MKEVAPKLAILFPCYNEELTIPHSVKAVSEYLTGLIAEGLISKNSFVAIVDDGSSDQSWEEIKIARDANNEISIRAIRFSRNFGHQNAVYAGLIYFQEVADIIISVDIDLQDDIDVIREMILKYNAGCQIVYGIRKQRDSDTFFKKQTALLYYRILKFMNVDIFYNHADYRLTSRQANEALKQFEETDLFLRGIFPYLGYKHDFVYYDRKERVFGESKYPFRKMLKLAWIGVLSFSSYPLDLIFKLALAMFAFSIVLATYILYAFLKGSVISGWTSLTLIISFFGSIQLLSTAFLSKYVGRMFDQSKKRPRFIIQETL